MTKKEFFLLALPSDADADRLGALEASGALILFDCLLAVPQALQKLAPSTFRPQFVQNFICPRLF
tara:strand:+ start:1510 stop:1704 length:195 start_codon:yes stop_codon:yes gene_type:complete